MEKTCKERVKEAFLSRMDDIRALYEAGYGVEVPDIGKLEEYGLCIDYVERGTWSKKGQPKSEPYWRYQLSWGGPSEEFRLYDSGELQFWFMDWFDGAYTTVKGEDAEIIKNIIQNAQ
jgi:hypothetical protein